MAIHSKVTISAFYSNLDPEMQSLRLFEGIKTIDFEDENALVRVKEYKNISIIFESENINAKLYFDLFEDIKRNIDNNTLIFEDELGFYIHPGTINIVNIVDKNIDTILVPGYYQMRVESEETLWGVLEIVPKDITKAEWLLMNNDIEDFLVGLSNTFSKKGNIETFATSEKNYDLVQILSFIKDNRVYFKNALRVLRTNPKYSIKKNYKWVSKNLTPRVDSVSIKNYVKHPEKKEEFYAPERIIDFNIKENRWFKYTLSNIKSNLTIILNDVNKRISDISSRSFKFKNEELVSQKELEKLELGRKYINEIFHEISRYNYEIWFNEVSSGFSLPSHSTLINPHFRLIEKWNANIVKEKIDTIFSEKLRNVWKKTDELYEIWCFIQIIKTVENLDFKIISGWVFDGDVSKDLDEGTVIVFEREEVKVKLHYNSKIKRYSNETNNTHPLFTNHRKNKPDIRIDYFVNHNYIYSIPIDSKYRKFNSIFNENDYGDMEQLRAYADSPKSNLHLKDANDIRRKHHKVISKVLVLYPFNNDVEDYKTRKKRLFDERIEMIEFSPGNMNYEVQLSIESAIEGAVELYNDIK